MDTAEKNSVKALHVTKRRMQSYQEFIKAYKEYKAEKGKLSNNNIGATP